MKVFIVVALIALLVACDARRAHRRKVRLSHGGHAAARVDGIPKPYEFEYAVKDAPTGNDFGHRQQSDGRVVTGSYRVLLPDGRTQVVTYRADENGYQADVRYEGDAIFPGSPLF